MSLKTEHNQSSAAQSLKRLTEKEQLAPAYLFKGSNLKDMQDCAISLVKRNYCQAASKKECTCLVCQIVESREHPDVVWVGPNGSPASIKIEQIRELKKRIALKPYEAKKKFFIIERAETMTEEAQNALLKTLEEPPANSHLILICQNAKRLLLTIASRCTTVKFESVLEEAASRFERGEIIDSFASLDTQYIEELFDCRTKEQFANIIECLMSFFRDLLIIASNAPRTLIINQDREKEIRTMAAAYSQDEISRMISFFNEMLYLSNSNVNLKLCIARTVAALKEFLKIEV